MPNQIRCEHARSSSSSSSEMNSTRSNPLVARLRSDRIDEKRKRSWWIFHLHASDQSTCKTRHEKRMATCNLPSLSFLLELLLTLMRTKTLRQFTLIELNDQESFRRKKTPRAKKRREKKKDHVTSMIERRGLAQPVVLFFFFFSPTIDVPRKKFSRASGDMQRERRICRRRRWWWWWWRRISSLSKSSDQCEGTTSLSLFGRSSSLFLWSSCLSLSEEMCDAGKDREDRTNTSIIACLHACTLR